MSEEGRVRRASFDRMTSHDAGYLTRETAAQPLHYVVQLDVAGRLEPVVVRDHLARRLDALPLAHRRTRYPLLAGRPVWVDDPDFAPSRHITPWRAPLHTAADADAAFVELTTRRLPRDRPLWDLTVGTGPGNSTTLWLSVHHAMMDGVLLASMLSTLFSTEDVADVPVWRPVRAPSRLWLLVLVVLRRLGRVVQRTNAPAQRRAPEDPRPTSMTGDVSHARAIAATTVELSAVKALRRRTGATVNDLFLLAVTEALRSYLAPAPEVVLALVPRNVRTASEAGTIGNRAWSMLVALPTGLDDPSERLPAIRSQTEAGKATEQTSGTQGWRFDVALTNVPLGGSFSLLGRPVESIRVSVPLQGQNRLVGVLTTFDDALTITWTADGAAYPDVARLAELTSAAWQRLLAEGAA